MARAVAFLTALIIAGLLLTGCGNEAAPPTTTGPTRAATPAPVTTVVSALPTAGPTKPATPTEALALLPTSTPPVVPTVRPPTPTARPGQSVPDTGPSLTAFRATRVSFLTAYGKAAARMSGTNGAARLVLAQSTIFQADRTVWTFFFTIPQGERTWSVNYDSAEPKEKKELISLSERPVALLPEEAGQWQASKVLDSDDLTTRLQRDGLPPDLPIDTVYVQQVVSTKQGRVPAYVFVNGALNKQIIVNALTGAVLQNDFL